MFILMSVSVQGRLDMINRSIMTASGLYLLYLLQRGAALWAFTIDPCPVLDTFTMEIVLAWSEDGFTAFFISHQAD